MIYLDNSATTKPCREAVEAMTNALTEGWANPSALYTFGIDAAYALRAARHKLAAAMGFLLGFGNALLAIVVMGVLMLGYSMAQRKMPLLTFLKTDIPMGPFISAGMMFAWMLPYFSW